MEKATVDLIQEHLLNELLEADKELTAAREKYNKISKIYYAFKEEMDNEGYVSYGAHDWRKESSDV